MCRPSQTPHLTMSSARIGPRDSGLRAKRRGQAPLPTHGISKITLKVVVFHLRPRAPTYPTPLKSFHKVGLESSSTGSSIPKSDERFARQYRFEPPPEFPLASPRSGIVHHLSGPDRRAPTRTLHRRSGSASGAAREGLPLVSFLAHPRFQNPSTRTHVRLLGPCFKTGRMGSPQAVAARRPEGRARGAR